MTPGGIAVVARQELTIRIRTGRWRWLLVAWFGALMLFTLLMRASIARVADADVPNKGVVVYGGLTLLVLALALLVVPALAAQSVNGDRERGTLATLQVTRLTAGDIAVGKLAAAWGTSLVFLVLTLPLVGYCMFLGGVPLLRVLVVTLVMALLLGSVIAMSLCLSAVLARTTTSGVLAYVVVFALTAGTLICFGIGTALSTESYRQQVPSFCPSRPAPAPPLPSASPGTYVPVTPAPTPCEPATSFEATRARTDRIWWLLAPNPFVILADAAPQLPPLSKAEQEKRHRLEEQGRSTSDLRDSDPLGSLGRQVRDLRLHPNEVPEGGGIDYAPSLGTTGADGEGSYELIDGRDIKIVKRRAVWPYGLAFDVLLGVGAVWLTTRRLKTPTRKLAKGQRVA